MHADTCTLLAASRLFYRASSRSKRTSRAPSPTTAWKPSSSSFVFLESHADKAYDFPRCRETLRTRGVTPRKARRGIESSEKLGRYRWVVERTLSWINRNRRLKVRYERRDDIHRAFLGLGCALICWRYVQRLC